MSTIISRIKKIPKAARYSLIALLIVSTFLLPMQAQAAFTDVLGGALFTGGGAAAGASIGCGIGAIVTFFVGGAGCLIGAGVGGLLGGVLGFFSGDATLAALIKFLVGVINWLANIVISVLLVYASQLLQFGVKINTLPITDFQPVTAAAGIATSIGNFFIVAIFIVIALSTILGIESYGVRRTLPMLIAIVLIVNFSTLFVGLLVDAGNTAMRFFWDSTNFKNINLPAFVLGNMKISQSLNAESAKSIEAALANAGTIQSAQQTSSALASAGLNILIILIGALAAYIFFRMGLIFIMRIGVFWVLIMIAPIVFVVGILPSLRKHLKDWWSQLLNWAFIGPLTFFFMFFGLIIWTEMNKAFLGGGINAVSGASPNTIEAMSPFFIFPIVALFFMFALRMAKDMAGTVANSVIDGAIAIGKGVALGTLALGGAAALGGVGFGLGKAAASQRVRKIGEALQQRGFRTTGGAILRANEEARKRQAEKVALAQGSIDDWIEKADMSTIRQRLNRADRPTRLNIYKAMMNHNKPLDETMQGEAVKYATTWDPAFRRELRRYYPQLDSDIYKDAKDPSKGLDYEYLRKKFAATSQRHRIDLSHLPASQRPEAFAALALTFNQGDLRRMAEQSPERLKQYRQLLNEVQDPSMSYFDIDKFAQESGYEKDYLQKNFAALKRMFDSAATHRSRGPIVDSGGSSA